MKKWRVRVPEVPVEGGTGTAVVSPAASTLRDEMAREWAASAGGQRADSDGRRHARIHTTDAVVMEVLAGGRDKADATHLRRLLSPL